MAAEADQPMMMHVYAIGSLTICLALLLSVIGLCWWLLWHAALKEIRIFREIMGLKKPVDAVKKQKAEEEVKLIKQQMRTSFRQRLPTA